MRKKRISKTLAIKVKPRENFLIKKPEKVETFSGDQRFYCSFLL